MITQELVNFIKQQISVGVSREQISQTLQSSGWSPTDIDEVFRQLAFPAQLPVAANKNMRWLLWIIIIILLSGVGYVIWAFGFQQKVKNVSSVQDNNQVQQNKIVTPSEGTQNTQEVPIVLGPKDSFLKINNELYTKVNTWSEYSDLVYKYGNAEVVAMFDSKQPEINATTEDFKQKVLVATKAIGIRPDEIKNIQETITGDTATLTIVGVDPKLTGKITMNYENGQWKLGAQEVNKK